MDIPSTFLSVVVAASAVIVGAIMQYMTLRTTRRNTLSSLHVGVIESTISELKSALAKWLTLTYSMDAAYQGKKYNNRDFPPGHVELALREDELYNLIRLQLDSNEPVHQQLLEAIIELRNGDSKEIWTVRRDAVISRAIAAFAQSRLGLF
jgi:hypothetical protein